MTVFPTIGSPAWVRPEGESDATSPITVTGSTANGNSADQGAGIFLEGAAAITNVTITGNQPGAGLEVVSTGGSTTVSFATISGNAVGIQTAGPRGALSLRGTIVANNSSDCRTPDQLMFLAFNLFGSQTCGVSTYGQYPPGSGQYSYGGPGNVFNVKPMLGPLQDNGGPTQTMAPLPREPCDRCCRSHRVPAACHGSTRDHEAAGQKL